MQDKAIQNNGKIIKDLKVQVNLRDQLKEYEQAGVQIGENLVKLLILQMQVSVWSTRRVQGVGNKMKALGAIARK